jgi:hypothetical protein
VAKTKQNIEQISSELEIDENLKLQERGWIIQRIGWLLMAVFVLSGLLGLFGEGPLSKKIITAGNQKLEYQKFSRHEARMELKFDLNSGATGNMISFTNQYLEKFRIESILPEPKTNQVTNERIQYYFEGSGPMTITFYLVPQAFGNMNEKVLANNQQLNFHQFIYP